MTRRLASRCAAAGLRRRVRRALAVGFGGSAVSDARRRAVAAGEDSPWPRTNALRPNVRALRRELARLDRQVELHGAVGGERRGLADVHQVRARQRAGRPRPAVRLPLRRARRHRRRIMDGIAVDRRRRPGREDYLFMHFRGTAAGPTAPSPAGPPSPHRCGPECTLAPAPGLRRQLTLLERKARAAGREVTAARDRSPSASTSGSRASRGSPSPSSAIPTRSSATCSGRKGGPAGYRAALHIDRSDWDDPDYMFLALVGGDRPGRHLSGRTRRGG